MGKRKLFLLFLSAMSLSIILMVLIYGLFIKDIDFNLNVKNPESAPSPVDAFHQDNDYVSEEERDPAKVSTPDNAEKSETKEETAEGASEEGEKNAITDVVPLEPQIGHGDSPPVPGMMDDSSSQANAGSEPSAGSTTGSIPSLHYVYLDGFSSREAAEQAILQLQDRKLVAYPYVRQHKGQIVLQFGVFSDRENAQIMADQLRNQNVYVKVD